MSLHLDHVLALTRYEQKFSRKLRLLSVKTSIGDSASERRTKLKGPRELTPPPLRRKRGCVVALLWCTSRIIKMKFPRARSQRQKRIIKMKPRRASSQRQKRAKNPRARKGLMGMPPVMSLRPTPPSTPPIYMIQRERRLKRAFLRFALLKSTPLATWRLHWRSERIYHRGVGQKRMPHRHQPVGGCRFHHRERSCYLREDKTARYLTLEPASILFFPFHASYLRSPLMCDQ